MADKKVIDDSHSITPKRGNGQLRREVWVDTQGRVTRYNLAYIHHALHSGYRLGEVIGVRVELFSTEPTRPTAPMIYTSNQPVAPVR